MEPEQDQLLEYIMVYLSGLLGPIDGISARVA